jgi:hypothetical protein
MWDEVILLNFQKYFSIEKYDMAWGDVTCSSNFQIYFSIEKYDVTWDDFHEFLKLFFNREKWRDWHTTWIFRRGNIICL